MHIQPVTLTGRAVILEPLSEAHATDLTLAGQDENIWRYMLYGTIKTEEQMRAWIREMLRRQSLGTDLPFAVVHAPTRKAIGATRYLEIRLNDRGLEIGGTWYAPEYQRTVVNTECKYLLLQHAFETLDCVRVQFKTDQRNERSQKAIERLGAKREGVLRHHLITPEGHIRDSVYYSIVEEEWPIVKAHLEHLLRAYEPVK